ncbi:MAG: DUF1684 domain-containing protein, partial [Pseudolysinimonas sp.]
MTVTDSSTDSNSNVPAEKSPEEQLAYFHERRQLAVTQPLGSLALTNTQVVDVEQPIWGVPGRWAPLPAGESGLKVIATAADGIQVDGVLVEGDAIVRGKDDPNPSDVVFSDTVRGVVITQAGGGYALRVWDAKSEAIENFGEIDTFAYNPEWIVTAAWAENPEGTTMGFEHVKDEDGKTDPREEVIPGSIRF